MPFRLLNHVVNYLEHHPPNDARKIYKGPRGIGRGTCLMPLYFDSVLASPVSEEIPATVFVTGRNTKYGLHQCNGKWAGPLDSPND